MGIFSKKDSATKKADDSKKVAPVKKEETKEVSKKSEKKISFDAGSVIRNPRITEKAAYASDKNVYTFDVGYDATKIDISKAIFEIYKVKPVKINISAVPTKRVYRRNSVGVKGGGKKAYVYLKKGDKIEFV